MMSEIFVYETTVSPDWIDYNGHMRDAYYRLIFSLAADALQVAVGMGQAYCEGTGCTVYLLEDHTFFLREVKEGAQIRVETVVLDCDAQRFHLYLRMSHDGADIAVAEFMELHVDQNPTPHAAPMPEAIANRLRAARVEKADLPKRRSRRLSL